MRLAARGDPKRGLSRRDASAIEKSEEPPRSMYVNCSTVFDSWPVALSYPLFFGFRDFEWLTKPGRNLSNNLQFPSFSNIIIELETGFQNI